MPQPTAINQITEELRRFHPATVFVTDKVYFNITEVIKKARKNYFGYFETESNDPVSSVPKTWVPLTEWQVESVVKTVDLDTKDILVLPKKPESVIAVRLFRPVLDAVLQKINFGQFLNDCLRVFCMDGTVVVKAFRGKDGMPRVKIVDLLNFVIDPSAESIQAADAVIERALMNEDEFKSYRSKGWKNIDDAIASDAPDRRLDVTASNKPSVPKYVVYERWGKGYQSWRLKFDDPTWQSPEGFIDTMEDQIVIASSKGNQSPNVLHYVGLNTEPESRKPYEEAWYRRVPNRWAGRGVAEQLFALQEYLNTVINIRKNNGLILQNGLFLIRKGSGITPQMLSNLSVAGGGIPVTNIDTDIRQLTVQDYRAASYEDEDRILTMSDRVTGARDPIESLGESSPATIGLIQQENIRSVFDLIQEGFGLFLDRLIGDHLQPMIVDWMGNDEVIRITGSTKELEDFDELIIDSQLNEQAVDFLNRTGFWPEEGDIISARDRARNELKKFGSNRFLKFKKSAFEDDVDIEVHITNEKLDKAVLAQNLRDMILAWARQPELSNLDVDVIFQELMNTLGIKSDIFRKRPQQLALEQRQQQAALAAQSAQSQGVDNRLREPRPMQEMQQGPASPTTAFENAAGLPMSGVR